MKEDHTGDAPCTELSAPKVELSCHLAIDLVPGAGARASSGAVNTMSFPLILFTFAHLLMSSEVPSCFVLPSAPFRKHLRHEQSSSHVLPSQRLCYQTFAGGVRGTRRNVMRKSLHIPDSAARTPANCAIETSQHQVCVLSTGHSPRLTESLVTLLTTKGSLHVIRRCIIQNVAVFYTAFSRRGAGI